MVTIGSIRRLPWTGRWIWLDTDGREQNTYVLFRKVFELDAVPERLWVRITATTRYRLYLNGTLVGEGPPKSQPYLTYFDIHEVDPSMHSVAPGSNAIAVVVQHVGYDDASRGGLLAEIRGPESEAPYAATDETWRAQRSRAWREDTFFVAFNRVVPYQEHFDSRRLDPEWNTSACDDAGWTLARQVTWRGLTAPPQVAPWTRLIPRDIPFMHSCPVVPEAVVETGEITAAMNRSRSGDLSISLSQASRHVERARMENVSALVTGDGAAILGCSTHHHTDPTAGIREPVVMLDFGRIINAWIELDVDGPAGAVVELGYVERLHDGHFNNAIEGQFADSVTLGGERLRWRCFAWKAFRYLRLRVHGAAPAITIHSLKAIETRYPFEDAGSFESDDRELNGIFEMCRSTLRLACNEYITDTPWREQGQWLGDVAAVTLGGIYACFGETALARKFLIQSAATQYPTGLLGNMTNTYTTNWQWVLVDFSLWWVMAVRDYYRYTGDTETLHELYSVAVRVIDAVLAYRGPSGLVERMPYVVFIDWADVDRTGTSAAFNAILAGALDAMREIAHVRGDTYEERRVTAAREDIGSAFSQTFWNEAEGLFSDAVSEGLQSSRFSEQTNAAAIEFGLASAAEVRSVVARLWEGPSEFRSGTNRGVTEANPFFASVVLRALSRTGRHDLAIALIRDRWGRRMLDQGSTSTHEEWSVHGSWRNGGELLPIMRTMSHAWSAFPAQWLIQYLAGITVHGPGCRKVAVSPARTELDYAVTFPTPEGSIRVTNRGGRVAVEKPATIEITD